MSGKSLCKVTRSGRSWFALLSGVFAILLTIVPAYAQQYSRTIHDGYTPTGVAQGAPAGSYPLSDFENINLFNGNFGVALPLMKVGGRGTASYTMMLQLDLHWEMYTEYTVTGGHNAEPIVTYLQDARFRAGRRRRIAYSPGILLGLWAVDKPFNSSVCSGPNPTESWHQYLTRLTFVMPDGTEIFLHDKLYGGEPFAKEQCFSNTDTRNRGRVFVSADGESMTFVSDADIQDNIFMGSSISEEFSPSGNLLMKDGTLYRIDGGLVSWIRDSNGNRISFTYDTTGSPSIYRLVGITDSLNRVISISYDNADYDEISFKGFGRAQRSIKIWRSSLANLLRPDFTIKTANQLFPEVYAQQQQQQFWKGDWDHNPTLVSQVELPDHSLYQFRYNSYGEVARIILPTGGGFDYEYGSPGGGSGAGSGSLMVYRRLTKRTVFNALTPTTDPVNPPAGTREKIEAYVVESPYAETPTVIRVEQRNSDNVLEAQSKHYFFGFPEEDSSCTPIHYSWWPSGKEFKTEIFNVSGGVAGAVLRKTEQVWSPAIPPRGGCYTSPPPNPKVVEIVTTLADANQVAKQSFGYDQYNNQTDVYEYDFGVGVPGPLIRRTQTSYLTTNGKQGGVNYAADVNIHIRNLPIQRIVYDSAENVRSQTDFIYDDYGSYQLVDRPDIVQHDGGFHTGYGTRGNLTEVIHRNPGGSPSEIHLYNQYDIAGNVVKTIDGRGNSTDIVYEDCFGPPGDDARSNSAPPELADDFTYAFPTKVTNALGHTTYTKYDYYLGKPVNSEDANGIVSSVSYDDPLDRPTQSIQARYKVGVGIPAEKRQTTIAYDNLNRVITTTSDRDAFDDNILKGKSYYDGLGRTYRSAAYEGSTWSITDTRFDALGRVSQVSNPYRAAVPDLASPPLDLWTMTEYDALGRVIRVTTPDSARVDTAYSGNQVTVTDQAGKGRRTATDALGRLVKVIEDPGGLNHETFYSYDALGNLRQVTQGSQTRSFVYDSLSRLVSATNPESGTVTYAYDANGNLIEKIDARGVKTTMTYDALNRVRTKTYSGTTPEGTAAANLTPPVNYFYDAYTGLPSGAPSFSGAPSKGRLVGVTYGPGSEGTYYRYDAIGAIVTKHQRMGTSNYVAAYVYNRAGAVTREDRGSPARRRIWMSYDAAGRLLGMQTGIFGGASGFEPRDLVRDISYTPFGGLQSETYGNELIHSMAYNNRHQPTEIRLGRADNLESVFRLGYIYGTAHSVNVQDGEIISVHNNGNIARIKYVISGVVQYAQTFQYDPLNRLRYAVEHNNGALNDGARAWYQTFEYDRYGNRGINVANTSDNVDASNSALQLADFSEANNRITRAGYVYDAAGNLIAEPGKGYTYDGENRIVQATVAGGATSQYVYDGNGRRVKKIVGSVGTRFEYGKDGELIAEWTDVDAGRLVQKEYFYKGGELLATTMVGSNSQYEYATADHVGSPRAWTDESGALRTGGRHDYLPFGEELSAGIGIRSAALGYGDDGVRQKFEQYERDIETGLDFAQARYFASVQGRFTSPDPLLESAKLENPQSWNRYAFVLNKPLVYIDPTGLLWIASGDANNPYRWVDECPQGGTCYESVAAAVNTGVVIYGSQNARDIRLYASNENGVVYVTGIANHPDARFDSAAGQQQNPEHYLNPQAAAALFNAARDYADVYPPDSDVVFTSGSAATGNAALNAQGEPVHRSHRNGENIDMRYMGTDGRPLVGNTASANADVNRMNTLFNAFANQNAGLGAALTGAPERFGFGPISAGLRAIHQNHFHLQRNYPRPPRPPQPARRRR